MISSLVSVVPFGFRWQMHPFRDKNNSDAKNGIYLFQQFGQNFFFVEFGSSFYTYTTGRFN